MVEVHSRIERRERWQGGLTGAATSVPPAADGRRWPSNRVRASLAEHCADKIVDLDPLQRARARAGAEESNGRNLDARGAVVPEKQREERGASSRGVRAAAVGEEDASAMREQDGRIVRGHGKDFRRAEHKSARPAACDD